MTQTVCFKNWLGEWSKDTKTFTNQQANAKRRLAWIKKNKALNGQATLQKFC